MSQSKKSSSNFVSSDQPISGAELTPIRVVERELVSPDGEKITVEVPVYPPFRLSNRSEKENAA